MALRAATARAPGPTRAVDALAAVRARSVAAAVAAVKAVAVAQPTIALLAIAAAAAGLWVADPEVVAAAAVLRVHLGDTTAEASQAEGQVAAGPQAEGQMAAGQMAVGQMAAGRAAAAQQMAERQPAWNQSAAGAEPAGLVAALAQQQAAEVAVEEPQVATAEQVATARAAAAAKEWSASHQEASPVCLLAGHCSPQLRWRCQWRRLCRRHRCRRLGCCCLQRKQWLDAAAAMELAMVVAADR